MSDKLVHIQVQGISQVVLPARNDGTMGPMILCFCIGIAYNLLLGRKPWNWIFFVLCLCFLRYISFFLFRFVCFFKLFLSPVCVVVLSSVQPSFHQIPTIGVIAGIRKNGVVARFLLFLLSLCNLDFK